MTVKELIEILSGFDENYEVVIEGVAEKSEVVGVYDADGNVFMECDLG